MSEAVLWRGYLAIQQREELERMKATDGANPSIGALSCAYGATPGRSICGELVRVQASNEHEVLVFVKPHVARRGKWIWRRRRWDTFYEIPAEAALIIMDRITGHSVGEFAREDGDDDLSVLHRSTHRE